MQKMSSAPQNSIHSWSAATLLIHPRPGVRPGPHFFVNFRHFQLFDCDQHNLSSYAMIVLHLLPFYSRNKFWIVWQRLCHKKNWNWISLLVAFAIIACMDCLPFLDFLFLVLLLNCSRLVLNGRRPCTKRVQRAIGTVCDARAKQFTFSYAFDKHRTSSNLSGIPCYVIDDGSTRTYLVSTERVTMSPPMMQKLKVARRKHGITTSCSRTLMLLMLLI